MSDTMMAIIGGTVTLIIVFLILTTNNGGAFTSVVNSIGNNYITLVKTFMGQNK